VTAAPRAEAPPERLERRIVIAPDGSIGVLRESRIWPRWLDGDGRDREAGVRQPCDLDAALFGLRGIGCAVDRATLGALAVTIVAACLRSSPRVSSAYMRCHPKRSRVLYIRSFAALSCEGSGALTKADLIESVSDECDLTKRQTGEIIDKLLDEIKAALQAGDKVQLIPFGSFMVRDRKRREGRNPKTGEQIVIAARRVPAFSAGKALRDAVGAKAGAKKVTKKR
jgi:DNA-binding protein HU-beta